MDSHPFNAGLIIRKENEYHIIATKDSYIKAKIEGVQRLVGKRLITPNEELEKAKQVPTIKP